MRDFLPEDVRRRQYVIDVIRRVYERYGFEPLETPALENIETLTGKYGEEGNRLIFKVLRRGGHESSGETDLALRYDLTVPLARVVAEHRGTLPKFFKRYQIQPVWRADRPARGRFREFYQCDVDAIGSTSPVVEAELIGAVTVVLRQLGFNAFEIRLNHRALLSSVLQSTGVPADAHGDALVAIDKLDKIGKDGVAHELRSRGVSDESAVALLQLFEDLGQHGMVHGAPAQEDDNELLITRFERRLSSDATGMAALANLRAIVRLCKSTPADAHLRFDPSLARGLSYYTGAIMEIAVEGIGSLGGGGRYDGLIGMFSGEQIPACGFSLGLERILVVMTERGMFPADVQTAGPDVLVTIFESKDPVETARLTAESLRLAGDLRAVDLRVELYPEADKLGKQFKYASARNAAFVAVFGGDELARGEVTIKNLKTGEQTSVARNSIAAHLRDLRAELAPPALHLGLRPSTLDPRSSDRE